MIKMKDIKALKDVYFIDVFCGAGGTSTGALLAGSQLLACINHDRNAIRSHNLNHPNTHHFFEDIRDFEVIQKLKILVEQKRREQPNCKIVLWASLDCTQHSNANGGKPKKEDSRGLARYMHLYIEALNPDVFLVENVREFIKWGPLDKNNKPIKKYEGQFYFRWLNQINAYGYINDFKILNSANYGACQKRKRLFIQFVKPEYAISWPEKTHEEKGESGGLFSSDLPGWKPVRSVLDLTNKGASIFERKKPLCEKSLNRIYEGLIKHVAQGNTEFMFTYNGNGSTYNLESPAPTVTTKDRISAVFIDQQYGKSKSASVNEPINTLTTNPKFNIIETEFLLNPQYSSKGGSVNKPCFTLIARMDKSPPYLISVVKGRHHKILPTDSEMTVKIKKFMIAYQIEDIKRRMLTITELKRIQGFPASYLLIGKQEEQKKYIGNAVEVNQAKALIENVNSMLIYERLKAA